jgi:Rps23 Pro-64 3,4-dihydroxylase Tpa1-like proline 4-hydroxylase
MADELIKLEKTTLEEINLLPDKVLGKFGNWINNIDYLCEQFVNAEPFEHVVIDDFLEENYADEIHNKFPDKFDNWHIYNNPIEVKYTYDNIKELDDSIKTYFYNLASNVMLDIFRKITKIPDLEFDEYLHGAGLHCHPRRGRLNIHLDYEKHPFTGKERRLNIIYFLSKDWKPEWNGDNELWDNNATKCIKKTGVKFNRAIIFKTNDISWHGLPTEIACPDKHYRKSLAFYYVSPLQNLQDKKQHRNKAKYIITEESDNLTNLKILCEIRSNRRLTTEDVNKYCPGWEKPNI